MNKKIFGIFVTVLAVAMLAAPVMAKPSNGPNKVAITMLQVPTGVMAGPPKLTGKAAHNTFTGFYNVTITFEDGSTLNGTNVLTRKLVVSQINKEGARWILTDHYVFTFPGVDPDTGFEGNGKVIMDSVVQLGGGGISYEQAFGYGLFHGTGDFEGQTLNAGHSWTEQGPIVWPGYWLKCSVYP